MSREGAGKSYPMRGGGAGRPSNPGSRLRKARLGEWKLFC